MKKNRNYAIGAIGGLAGGTAFGIMMAMMGMMPMIASMVGSKSSAVGWIIHFIISAIIGVFYVWWFGKITTTWMRSAGFGLLHGFIWWILGALTIMPLIMGMGVQYANAFKSMNMMSLLGHFMYGLIVGLVYFGMTKSKSGVQE